MSLGDYHALVRIRPDEMWELRNQNPDITGIPVYYCVEKNGRVWFHPKMDPEKCTLMCKEGVV